MGPFLPLRLLDTYDGVSTRAKTALARAGYFFAHEVENLPDADLGRIPDIGPKRLTELRAAYPAHPRGV